MIAPNMPPPRRRGGLVPVLVLAVVATLLAGAAVWLFLAADSTADRADRATAEAVRDGREARRLTESVDPDNIALTDPDATTEVTDQLRTVIERTFSYDHADLDATARAVDRYLTDTARCQHDQIFEQVRELAPAQRIVMRTAVRQLALVRLTGEGAEALVFVDQSSTRGDTDRSVAAEAQFAIQARLDGDTWQVTRLDFFDQPLVDGERPMEC